MKRGIEPDSPLYEDFQGFTQKLRRRIVEIRHQKSMTQEEMQECGLSLRQYQRIESGETENVTLANLYRVASALGIPLSQLLDL